MQSIQDISAKIKLLIETIIDGWGTILIVLLVALGSFGLGRLSVLETVKAPVSISQAPSEATPRGMNIGGLVLASRTGNSYHFPWCASAAQIAPQNQVWFASEEKARAAGYSPAKNCKGLEK